MGGVELEMELEMELVMVRWESETGQGARYLPTLINMYALY